MALPRTHIVIHHSFTQDGQTVSWGAIEKYHKETMGWKDIGYHAGVELIQDGYYALMGRAENAPAAAVKEAQMNLKGLHVCCVGNYDLQPPPQKLLDVLVERVVLPWAIRYDIPVERIMGHRDWASYKTCPGSKFDLQVVRDMVKAKLPKP